MTDRLCSVPFMINIQQCLLLVLYTFFHSFLM